MSVSRLHNGIHLSISALALEFGCSRELIRSRLAESDVQPSGKKGGYPVYRLRDVINVMTKGDAIDPDTLDPIKRKAYFQSLREELHLQLERRDVIPALEVEQRYASRNKAMAQKIDACVDEAERDAGFTQKQLAWLDAFMDRLRMLLRDVVTEDDDGVRQRA